MKKSEKMNKKITMSLFIVTLLLISTVTLPLVSAGAPYNVEISIIGPDHIAIGQEGTVEVDWRDSDDRDNLYFIKIDWGDEVTDFMGPYTYNSHDTEFTHSWDHTGINEVSCQVVDDPNMDGDYSDGTIVDSDNTVTFYVLDQTPPTTPSRPAGPNEGIPGDTLLYTTESFDFQQENLYYKWRIRRSTPDGSTTIETDWIGPYTYPEYTCNFEYTFHTQGKYYLYAKVIDDLNGDGDLSDGQETEWSPNMNVWISELPLPPTIEGPSQAAPYQPLVFTITPNDDSWFQRIQMDWGKGDGPGQWGDTLENQPVQKSYMYLETGEYLIRARTREGWTSGNGYRISDWAEFTIEIVEPTPDTPELSGSEFAFIGQSAQFTAQSTCLLDSTVQYLFDWGNGEDSYWIPQDGIAAGKEINTNIVFDTAGSYPVRVKARNAYNHSLESDWSEPLEITVHSLQLKGLQGGLKPSFTIQNSGEVSKDVEWSVEFIGGIPGFHLNRQFSGTIESVKPETTETVQLPTVFGLGSFNVAITLDIAGEDAYTQTYEDVFILFFFVRT